MKMGLDDGRVNRASRGQLKENVGKIFLEKREVKGIPPEVIVAVVV